ncbi:MAG: 30S ribosomal protein S7 [Candidatus Saganbacteria bacterium]|nr:30S ribosomal protein S7 [Candidatus Saganbacteria bacterium]
MPRYGRVKKRKLSPDAVLGSEMVHKFINKLMFDGKKSKAEIIFYAAMDLAKEKLKKEPLEIFSQALDNIRPQMEVKARRVGGSTYQVPIEVSRERGLAIAMQWLRDVSRNRAGKSMAEKLASELVDAYNNIGGAAKKREELHKTAEANRAFAHFRW